MTDLADIELDIPPKPEFVALARHVIGVTARLGSLSVDSVDNVKLAVSEAVTNAVTVSDRAGSSDPVHIRAEIEGDRLHVWVSDRGISRTSVMSEAEHEPDSLDFTFERGLSLPLLEGLVDDLEIAERDGGGNVLRMTILNGAPDSE